MILDRSDHTFSSKELKDEWLKKAKQFQEVMDTVGIKASALKGLIDFCNQVYRSDLSHHLFPGEKMDRLVINQTSSGKIDFLYSIVIQLNSEQENEFEIIQLKKTADSRSEILKKIKCSEKGIFESFFNEFVSKSKEFK